jgi:hypothetical protein
MASTALGMPAREVSGRPSFGESIEEENFHRNACATSPSVHRHPLSRGHSGEDHRQVSNSNDDDYRNLAVKELRPSELDWALNHDVVHGIAYAFKNPVAIAEASDDPNDDRKTYLIQVKRDDLARALEKINEWIVKNPGKAGMHAYGFVRALSREGLERRTDDEERC